MDKSVEPKPRSGRGVDHPVRCMVLVLHGGKVDSHARSRPWHLSRLRMWHFTWALRRAGRGRGIAVAQVQYRYRGWNGGERSPVHDARRELLRARREFPDTSVVLVGHSMGGRTAAAIAEDPAVIGIVALAPWWPDGGELDSVRHDQVVRVLHGAADTWTDAGKSRRAVDAARARGVDAVFDEMVGGHFMIRRARSWVEKTTNVVMSMAGHVTADDGVRS